MKKILMSFIIVSFTAGVSFSQGTWTQLNNFPATARYASAFFTIGNKGYMGTGYDGAVRNDFWEYDPATDAWTQKANFGGTPRFHAGCFSIGNKGYIGLGSAGYPIYSWPTDFWEYDPVTNVWTQRANFPSVGRYTVASFSIGTKGYLGTGWRSGPVYNDFYEYDQATDTWTQIANFGGSARQSTTFFVINNKGYVGAGAFNSNVYNDFWEYNPATGIWTQRATIPGPNRNAAAAFTLGSYGYVGLGSSTYPTVTFLNDFWRYDPVADSWIQIINFPGAPRYSVFTFSFGCEAYLGSGESGPTAPIRTFNNDLWKFNFPITAAFTSVPSACVGTPVNFNNTSMGATDYYWDFGDNSTDTVSNPSHAYSAPGTYQVLLIASHNCSNDSSVQTVTVNPNPVPLITPGGPTNFCLGDSVILTASGGISYLWSTSDTVAIISVNASGNYTVTVTDVNGCTGNTSATVTVYPLPVAAIIPNGPLALCPGDSVILTAGSGTSYLWSTGATTQSITISTAGIYWVVVSNGFCSDSDTIQVQSNFFSINLGNDTIVCNGSAVTLNAGAGTSWLWSTGQTTQTINVNSTGIYWVQVGLGPCVAADTIQVTISALSVNIGNDTSICNGNMITLNAGIAGTYLWSTGQTTQTISVNSTGTYWVVVSNGFCSDSDTIQVQSNFFSINIGNDTIVCNGNIVTLDAGAGTSWLWSTGQTTQTINVNSTGTYWVQAGLGTCVAADTILVTISTVSVNIGNDTSICNGNTITLNAGTAADYLWSTGDTSSSINISSPGIYWVEVNSGSCYATDSIIISDLATSINLGEDIVTCESVSILLDAGVTGASYLWSTGEISRTIEVLKTGTYWVNVMAGNCMASDTIEVTVDFGGGTIYFPNAFTPNEDRINNVFKAQGTDVTYFYLQIYNRWGELCFESKDITEGWDGTYRGKKVGENSFVWICDYMTTCTQPVTMRKIGHVSIIK